MAESPIPIAAEHFPVPGFGSVVARDQVWRDLAVTLHLYEGLSGRRLPASVVELRQELDRLYVGDPSSRLIHDKKVREGLSVPGPSPRALANSRMAEMLFNNRRTTDEQ